MKKGVLVILCVVIGLPVMAVEVGGQIDVNYFMEKKNDDTVFDESYFGAINTKLWVSHELGEGMTGLVMLALPEDKSNGMDSTKDVSIEEMWIEKKGAFGQEALGFKFGKMEVPFNLDYDIGITHALTNSVTGVGEIDFTWGINVSYDLGEAAGIIKVTTIEAMGGESIIDEKDEDPGLFKSMVMNWDTGNGKDAFGVAGLRLVVAYAMLAQDENADDGTIISIGATYTPAALGLILALEYDMATNIVNGDDGSTLLAANADYDISEDYAVGLSYEIHTFTDNNLVGTLTRMAVRGSVNLNDVSEFRLEYVRLDSTKDDAYGGSMISLGLFSKF